ncbi:hypothetical protein BH09PSE1_BH09PSE1_11030 [soil metagenome]
MAATFTTDSAPRPLTARQRTLATYRNLALWTLQGWIAMFFIAAGYAKLTESMDNLTTLMSWPALVSEQFVRGLGIAEIVLAVGLLAPLVSWKVGRPLLMVAAVGLVALEAVMLGVHALGGDIGLSIVNVILLGLTIPVLLGRRA